MQPQTLMQAADSLAFASAGASGENLSDPALQDRVFGDFDDAPPSHRESMYTTLLRELATTVVKHEAFLFSPTELELLRELDALSYPARYLLIRLSLRTRSKLHRLSDLAVKYTSELGPHLTNCIDELCRASLSRPYTRPKDPGIAIKGETKEAHQNCEVPSYSYTRMEFESDVSAGGPCPKEDEELDTSQSHSCFVQDESSASTEELLNCLKLDEMKKLGVETKIYRTGMTRETLKSALLDSALKQTTLPLSMFTKIPRRSSKRDTTPPTTSINSKIIINLVTPTKKEHPTTQNQLTRLRQMILSVETKFIRVSEEMFTLLQRVNLVYFRCTALSSNSILLPLILARSKKRQYPIYEATRTINVFTSRDALIRYEEALRVEDELDKASDNGSTNRFERAKKVLEIFQTIYSKWKGLVAEECREGKTCNRPGLERFEEGHVLTRIVYKGAQALGHLKRYKEEVRVLRELLGQERWRKRSRGEWYDRLALVLMTHLKEPPQAMGVLITALSDPLIHIVCRPRLILRLTRIEKKLKLPPDQCTKCDTILRKAQIRIVRGTRVSLPKLSKSPSTTPLFSGGNLRLFTASRSPFETHPESEKVHEVGHPTGNHSLWVGKTGAEIGVEECALEHYATLGFRGFHSEGRIVHHLFLLLFWSIIFQPVPGAFETSYQIAPLDLGHDSFYHTRQAEIQQRLQEIKDGKGPQILEEVDDRERPRKTFAIGARWEQFTKEDALEIVKCIGGNALAIICRVVAEDYSHRSSGVPDLLLWNARAGKAKFVEVKGPGDTLMETQKVWIDVLLNCGMDVEVCHVKEHGEPDKPKRQRQPRKESRQTSKAVDIGDTDSESSHGGDRRRPGVDYDRIDSGNSDNPIVVHNGEVDDHHILHQNRKRSRVDSESLVSGESSARRKRHASSII